MTDEPRRRAVMLLADYLVRSAWVTWPGVEAVTAEQVVTAEYPRAAAAGAVPRPAELFRRHADLAAVIASLVRSAGPAPP